VFAKLVVLILVFGASGVGLLSVRQSRLQAVHEMAESRHRIRRLQEQGTEIRTMIVRSCTPQRVIDLLKDRGAYTPASAAPAKLQLAQQVLEQVQPDPEPQVVSSPQPQISDDRVIWTLEDGTRVVFERE
jgi:hypothetical protein